MYTLSHGTCADIFAILKPAMQLTFDERSRYEVVYKICVKSSSELRQVSAGRDRVVLHLALGHVWSVAGSWFNGVAMIVHVGKAASLTVQFDVVRVGNLVVIGRRRWLVVRCHTLMLQFRHPA